MGYSISWIAAQTQSPEEVRNHLRVRPTGASGHNFDFPVSGSAFSSWYVIVLNKFNHPLQRPPMLKQLSLDRPVIRCQIEEHVMYGSAECWNQGKLTWLVRHDPDKGGVYHLDAEGVLPADFDAIRSEFKQRQDDEGGERANVDLIFEIPFVLARQITGFKHDEWRGADEAHSFEELAWSRWKRLFG